MPPPRAPALSFLLAMPVAPRRSSRLRARPPAVHVPVRAAGSPPRKRARVAARRRVASTADIEDAPSLSSLPSPSLSPLPSPSPASVLSRLRAHAAPQVFTHPKTQPRPLLDSLIATVLSQATTNINSSRAFGSLKRAFPTWEVALAAGVPEIEDAIRSAGLARQKSRVIHGILEGVRKRKGSLSLQYLHELSDEEVKRELGGFKGVGPKTIACVLMFGMRRDEFPVDTHIRRIAGRLGWMPLSSSAESTYQVLNKAVPSGIKYDLHVALIQHGRSVCTSQKPKCDRCPLIEICPKAGVAEGEQPRLEKVKGEQTEVKLKHEHVVGAELIIKEEEKVSTNPSFDAAKVEVNSKQVANAGNVLGIVKQAVKKEDKVEDVTVNVTS